MKKPLVNPVIGENDPEFQKLIKFYDETLGFCPNSVKTMFHRPAIAHAFIELNKAVMQNQGRVSSSLKRLIAYISSYAAGCRYCQAHAIRAAERYGAEKEKLFNISGIIKLTPHLMTQNVQHWILPWLHPLCPIL